MSIIADPAPPKRGRHRQSPALAITIEVICWAVLLGSILFAVRSCT